MCLQEVECPFLRIRDGTRRLLPTFIKSSQSCYSQISNGGDRNDGNLNSCCFKVFKVVGSIGSHTLAGLAGEFITQLLDWYLCLLFSCPYLSWSSCCAVGINVSWCNRYSPALLDKVHGIGTNQLTKGLKWKKYELWNREHTISERVTICGLLLTRRGSFQSVSIIGADKSGWMHMHAIRPLWSW